MGAMGALAFLIAASVVLTAIGMALHRRYGHVLPFLWTALYAAGVGIAGTMVVFSFIMGISLRDEPVTRGLGLGYGELMLRLCAALLIYFPPLAMAARFTAGYVSEFLVGALQDSSIVTPAPTAYGKARALAAQGAIIGAVRQYRSYFDEDPSKPTPLFAAADLLTSERQYEQAVPLYTEIMMRFEKNAWIWGEAALRLAELYEDHMRDRARAEKVLRDIVKRARHPEHREKAAALLMREGPGVPQGASTQQGE